MADEFEFSLYLGAFIGAVYVLIAYLSFRFAIGRSQRTFLIVAIGGISVRLFIAVGAIALVLALVAVNQPAFVGGFFAVFVLGLILEVVLLHRRQVAVSEKANEKPRLDIDAI